MNLRIINTSIGRTHVPELLSSTRRGVVANYWEQRPLFHPFVRNRGARPEKGFRCQIKKFRAVITFSYYWFCHCHPI